MAAATAAPPSARSATRVTSSTPLAQAFRLTASGDAEWLTGDVLSILGRPARSFEQFAADHAAAFS